MKKRFLQLLIALRDGKSVPAIEMSEKLIDELLSYGAVIRVETIRMISRKNFNDFIYDIGLLPDLLEHDLAEAELEDDNT